MKAKLDLIVLAPDDWIVLGNQPETRFESVQKETESLFNVNELMRGQF
jgi:sarcosine oxidase gamma subunit